MIHNVAHTVVSAPAARRVVAAEADHPRTARPQPAADSEGAVVEIDRGPGPVAAGGFGLDLAYSRQVIRQGRGQGQHPQVVAQSGHAVSLEFRFATSALPRGEDGEVDVEALANTDEKNALADAISRIAEEGLRDPGALASFVNAVDDMFGEYERDLGMSAGELEKARQVFVDEVKGFFAQVDSAESDGMVFPTGDAITDPFPEGFESLDAALDGLRERLMSRRQDVLTAAGDLSKVLAELTAAAEDAPAGTNAEGRASARLGDYLRGMKDALARRSTAELRGDARQRLLETDAEIVDRAHRRAPADDAARLGRNFIQFVHAH